MYLLRWSAFNNLVFVFTVLQCYTFIQDVSTTPQYPQLFGPWQPYPHFINAFYPMRAVPELQPPSPFVDQRHPLIHSTSGFHQQTAFFPPQDPLRGDRFPQQTSYFPSQDVNSGDRYPSLSSLMSHAFLSQSPYNPIAAPYNPIAHLFWSPSGFNIPTVSTNLQGNPQSIRESSCAHFDDIGICYKQNECLSKSGRPTVYCRDFSKFCCVFQTTCGGSYSEDVIYFRNPSWPLEGSILTSCGVNIKKKDDSICSVRINPQSLNLPANPGYCDDIGIAVTGVPGSQFDTLCGNMNGKIYDIDIRSTQSIDISIQVNQRYRAKFYIEISQVPCTDFIGSSSWPQGGTSAGGKDKVPSNPTSGQDTDIIDNSGGSPPIKPPHNGLGWPVQSPPVLSPAEAVEAPGTSTTFSSQCGKSGIRSQDLLRDDEERKKPGPSYNPLLQSLAWDVATVTDSIFHQYAGVPNLASGRITYGTMTQQYEYPWSVAMYANGRFHCGASLISEKHILTAAHCVIKKTRIPSSLKLSIGDWNINSQTDGVNIEGKVAKIATHPGYSQTTLKYDVAVLTLTEKVELSASATPICLPASDIQLDGELVTVTGWGRDEKNKLQAVLMEHSANVVPNSQCNDRWSEKGAPAGIIASTMMCMDPQNGDSCKGDSGGPAVMEYPANSGKFVQVGIVSFGSASCTDKNLPGVYTKVGMVIDWIKEQMV